MRALLSSILVLEWALAYTMCLYISEIPESGITVLGCVLGCVSIFTLCDNDRPF